MRMRKKEMKRLISIPSSCLRLSRMSGIKNINLESLVTLIESKQGMTGTSTIKCITIRITLLLKLF